MNELIGQLSRGGVMMIPLSLISVIALTVALERAIFLRRRKIIPPGVVEAVLTLREGSHVEQALVVLKGQEGPFLNIVRAGLGRRGRSRPEIKEAIIDQGRQEIGVLERGLTVLETIAGIAPLMGLMGTVLGMIKVFSVISEQGLGQTQLLSGGISEALITTVVGLAIAIPTLIAFNYFTRKVETLVLDMEKYSARLIDKLDRVEGKGEEDDADVH